MRKQLVCFMYALYKIFDRGSRNNNGRRFITKNYCRYGGNRQNNNNRSANFSNQNQRQGRGRRFLQRRPIAETAIRHFGLLLEESSSNTDESHRTENIDRFFRVKTELWNECKYEWYELRARTVWS